MWWRVDRRAHASEGTYGAEGMEWDSQLAIICHEAELTFVKFTEHPHLWATDNTDEEPCASDRVTHPILHES